MPRHAVARYRECRLRLRSRPALCDAIAADAGRLWADGFPEDPVEIMPPSHKRMAVTSVGLAAALLAPAALGAGLYAAFAASPHSVTRSHDYAIAPPQGTQPATAGSEFIGRHPGTGGRTHQKGAAADHVDLPDRANLGAGDRDNPDAEAEADHADDAPVEPAGDQIRSAVRDAEPVAD